MAGNGGPATAAQLNRVFSVALDGAGGVYISDYENHAIRFVSPEGFISVVAGSLGQSGFAGALEEGGWGGCVLVSMCRRGDEALLGGVQPHTF